MAWHNRSGLNAKTFVCWSCGNQVASEVGYLNEILGNIYLCPNCNMPNFIQHSGERVPGPKPGANVEHLPEDIDTLYQEARRDMSVNSYTSTVMCCRKILMNVAVSQGAPIGKKYAEYVNYLVDNHIIVPSMRGWVDKIRDKGNEANHELPDMSEADARNMLDFTEMLLKLIYEYPNRATV